MSVEIPQDDNISPLFFTNRVGTNWSENVNDYLQDIWLKCSIYRDIHEQSAIYCEKNFKRFSFALIVVSFIVTSVSVVTWNVVICDDTYKYVVAILSALQLTLSTINRFVNFQENATRHRIASQKFLELNQTIAESLLSPVNERVDGIKFINWATSSFRNIRKGVPYAPNFIKRKYDTSPDDMEILDKSEGSSSEESSSHGSVRNTNPVPPNPALPVVNPAHIVRVNDAFQQYQMKRMNFVT